MKRAAIVIAAGIAFAAALPSTPASATLFRTFVSGTGSDSNPCTRTQPCLTFSQALTQTNAGGEIDVLDPGGYGPFTIDKAISIVNDGVGTAGIRALPGGIGITINAGVSDNISLRGLTIEGAGMGHTGIRFNTGHSLTIDHCVVRNFLGDGIDLLPSTSGTFLISSTSVSSNSNQGIIIVPQASASVTGIISDVVANSNAADGVAMDGSQTTATNLRVTVANSMFSNNGSVGLGIFTLPGKAATSLLVRNSVTSNNGGWGLNAAGSPTAIMRVGHSVITENGIGAEVANGAVIASYGDNDINGNNNDGLAALSSIITH